ncbi:hypothetical protein I3760_12G028400 [Carya illinoinensis]|nr:hypothetical protein I3760_12G028400 [Carya illinoinensis]
MALVNHQMQGSYSTFISRPLLWDKELKTKQYVNMVAKADRCFILKHDVCLSVGASCKREKLKPSRISAFKGSAQNNESAGRASGSKVPENSVKLKGSEDPVTESPKANDVPLSFISEANESIGSSPAIQKLFLKWLTMLHTQSPSQVVDGVLEEPPISELSKIQQLTQNKEREKILRAAWYYFLCLDATHPFIPGSQCGFWGRSFKRIDTYVDIWAPYHSSLHQDVSLVVHSLSLQL